VVDGIAPAPSILLYSSYCIIDRQENALLIVFNFTYIFWYLLLKIIAIDKPRVPEQSAHSSASDPPQRHVRLLEII
jgi:hypothetical protein